MTRTRRLLVVAGVLLLVGVLLVLLRPPGAPDLIFCTQEETTTVGVVQVGKATCRILFETWTPYPDLSLQAQPARIAGLLLVLGGLATGGLGLIRGRRPAP